MTQFLRVPPSSGEPQCVRAIHDTFILVGFPQIVHYFEYEPETGLMSGLRTFKNFSEVISTLQMEVTGSFLYFFFRCSQEKMRTDKIILVEHYCNILKNQKSGENYLQSAVIRGRWEFGTETTNSFSLTSEGVPVVRQHY